jgi:Glyoxalase-like domain
LFLLPYQRIQPETRVERPYFVTWLNSHDPRRAGSVLVSGARLPGHVPERARGRHRTWPRLFLRLAFLRVTDLKTVKNRLYIDLNPADQQAEMQRLLALGSTRIDIGPA